MTNKIKKIEYEDNILVIEFVSGEKIIANGHLSVDVIKDNFVTEPVSDGRAILYKTKNDIVTTIQLRCIEKEEHIGFFYIPEKYDSYSGQYIPTETLIHKEYKNDILET